MSTSLCVKIPRRILQCATWDCGLACACIAIDHFKAGNITPYHAALDFKHETESVSVWSIDVVALLLRHGLDVSFFTTTLGVSDDLMEMPLYTKDSWTVIKRVEQLFQVEAISKVARKQSLTWQEVADLLKSKLVIVLVDKSQLRCVNEEYDSDVPEEHSFEGHFVLLYAFQDNHFLYHDPDRRACGACRMSVKTFEEARTARGTDEDIIVVGPPPVCNK